MEYSVMSRAKGKATKKSTAQSNYLITDTFDILNRCDGSLVHGNDSREEAEAFAAAYDVADSD
jgi:hypothetical protein